MSYDSSSTSIGAFSGPSATHIIQVCTAIIQHLSSQTSYWRTNAEKAREMIERLSNQNDGLHQVNQEQQVRIAELEYQIREIHAWGGVKSGVDSSHSMSTSQLGEAGLAIVAGENSTYLEGCDQPIKCSNNLG